LVHSSLEVNEYLVKAKPRGGLARQILRELRKLTLARFAL